jgi:hypothetical protein
MYLILPQEAVYPGLLSFIEGISEGDYGYPGYRWTGRGYICPGEPHHIPVASHTATALGYRVVFAVATLFLLVGALFVLKVRVE